MVVLEYHEFLNKTSAILEDTQTGNQLVAIILINLGELCELDGVFGHAIVDNILMETAKKLAVSLRADDLVGIIGRYQLACLLPGLSNASQAELAGHKIIRVCNTPFAQGKHQLILSARIGIALSNNIIMDSSELFRQAHSAMSQACRDQDVIRIYSPKVDKLVMSQLDLLSDMDKAIKESRIFLAYQPQLNLKTGKIEGAEALLRWTHPELGAISPDNMVQLAEKTGLISKLTFWVFHTAMRQCAEYRSAGLDVGVSVNFSAQNLMEPDLVGIVSQALGLWNVPANQVIIELTETAIMKDHLLSDKILRQFKDMGLQIAMDDFGTGYSSLALLHKLPIDKIKIDISFIQDMMVNPENEKIVDSIISLSHKLGILVIAEGIEDSKTCERLGALDCDLVQGYLISRPLILPEFITMVLAYNAVANPSPDSHR